MSALLAIIAVVVIFAVLNIVEYGRID